MHVQYAYARQDLMLYIMFHYTYWSLELLKDMAALSPGWTYSLQMFYASLQLLQRMWPMGQRVSPFGRFYVLQVLLIVNVIDAVEHLSFDVQLLYKSYRSSIHFSMKQRQ